MLQILLVLRHQTVRPGLGRYWCMHHSPYLVILATQPNQVPQSVTHQLKYYITCRSPRLSQLTIHIYVWLCVSSIDRTQAGIKQYPLHSLHMTKADRIAFRIRHRELNRHLHMLLHDMIHCLVHPRPLASIRCSTMPSPRYRNCRKKHVQRGQFQATTAVHVYRLQCLMGSSEWDWTP